MGFLVVDLSADAFLRVIQGHLRTTRRVRHVGEVTQDRSGYAAVERLLVDGRLLPDPLPAGQSGAWIDENQWDWIVYAQSTAQAARAGLTFADYPSAIKKCGLYEGLTRGSDDVNTFKRQRRESLIPALERFGFLESVCPGPYQNKTNSLKWKRLMLVPVWPPGALAPITSGVAKSTRALEDHKRSYFMMPEAIFNKGVWQQIGSHRGRRVIAALYAYYDGVTYEAVNPNHLRIRGKVLEVSDSFLRACGEATGLRDVMWAINWLVSDYAFFPMASEFEAGRPYPAGDTYVTWARPVARNVPTDTVVFVPRWIPTQEAT